MANVLISYYSDYGEAMYDAITAVLHKNGNNIFRININNPSISITKWGGESCIINNKLLNQIKNFSADVVLNFNNSLPQNCYNILENKCKICVLDADAPELAFWNKQVIVENYDKILWLGLQSYSKTMYERLLNNKLTSKNYLYFPPATIVKNENLQKNKNISFIGSNFYPLRIPNNDYFYTPKALELYNEFEKDYFYSFKNAKENYACTQSDFDDVRAYYVGQQRLKYMQQLTDLGLVLYGVRWWNKIAYYDFEIAKCFDKTKVTTVEENQKIYNTSKISINISHPLAKSSFSWRVMDIMASGSCLLMEDKPDWRDLFEKYLSKKTLETVIYKNRFDMREKAKILLANEALRLKCVSELNYAIEKNGRWEVRFDKLEKFANIRLMNLDNKNAKITFIQREEENFKLTKKGGVISRFISKNRYKIFIYSLMLALAQIPILDLFLTKIKRNKLRKKIDKYWR